MRPRSQVRSTGRAERGGRLEAAEDVAGLFEEVEGDMNAFSYLRRMTVEMIRWDTRPCDAGWAGT
jgi:hypothetical protein